MSLCNGCRFRADRIAKTKPSPDAFKLKVGAYAEAFGHTEAHKEIARQYEEAFGTPTLDQWLAA